MRDLRSRWNLLVAILALTTLVGSGVLQAEPRSAQRNQHDNDSLAANGRGLNFGSVVVGSQAKATEYIYNPTSSSVTISNATPSSADYQIISPAFPVTIAPRKGIALVVGYTPSTSGRSTATILISSSASQPSLTISASGQGIASGKLIVNPATASFGNVQLGKSQSLAEAFTNSGATSVTISQVVPSTSDFEVTGLTLPLNLAPHGSANFRVVFTPKAAGARHGSISATAAASMASPSSGRGSSRSASVTSQDEVATVVVSGMGMPVTGTGTGAALGQVTAAPASFSFGSPLVGSTQSKPLVITNTGTASVIITQAAANGAGYMLSGPSLPMTLAANQAASFSVTFVPASAGADNGAVVIASNAANPSLNVALSATPTAPTTAALTAGTASLSFGKVTIGSTQTLPETLKNSGSSAITVTQVAAGAGYTVTGLSLPLTLSAGQSASFSVAFAPQSAESSNVNLAITNTGSTPTLAIPLSGTGMATGALASSSVSFGSVQVGSSSAKSATLSNSGGSSVTVSQANLTGTGYTMSGLSLPMTLAAGQNFTFSVTFAPTSAGPETGSIALVSTASSTTPPISLSGTGTASGQFSVSPGSFSFGSVAVGANKSLPATLTATGSSVTVTSASVSSAEFALTGPTLPATIPAGGTASFTLTFTPQASGAATAMVSFATNAVGSPISESLTGSGTAAIQHTVSLSWSPSSSTVAGYNVYRGGVSGGPYAKLTSSADASTNYTDSSVQAGQTYYYVTTSVGTDAMESSYSNQVSAVIPTP